MGGFPTIISGAWNRVWIMTPADVFLKSYIITGKSERLDVAETYARWLISISVPEYDGLKVPLSEDRGFYHASINARIFNFIVKLYTVTGKREYLDYAYKLLTWIEAVAAKENGYSWPIRGKEDPTFPSGSSGVGYYIIDAISASTKEPISAGPLSINIEVSEPVPFNRLFDVNVTVTNRGGSRLSLDVVLEERTGFQAGMKYGDGDEVRSVVLGPGESAEVSFKARVYGVPRSSEEAVVRVYSGGDFVGGASRRFSLRPEFANMTTVIAPSVVGVGEEFMVAIPVFYSFSSSAGITVTLKSLDNGREVSQSKSLEGDGMELYVFRVKSELMGSNTPGVRGFEAILRVGYPEEGYRTVSEERLRFSVVVVSSAGSSTIRPMWGYTIELELGGERYLAVKAYNASSPLYPGVNFKNLAEWVYSRRNWLIFRVTSEGLEIVRDDSLYKTLAMAAEVVDLRASYWSVDHLDDRYRQLIGLRNLAIVAESLLFTFKLASKLLGVIVAKKVEALATSASSGFYAGAGLGTGKIDLAIDAEKLVKVLEAMDLYGAALEAVDKAGGVTEDTIAWLSIIMIDKGANRVSEANRLLRGVELHPGRGPVRLYASAEEALKFYQLFAAGDSMASAGSKLLATRYEEKGPAYLVKQVLLDAIPLGSAAEFYEALREGLGSEDVIEFSQYLAMAWEEYDTRFRVLQEKALDFRDAFIEDTSSSIEITLLREGAVNLAGGESLEGDLYLAVIDSEGRISGFDPESGVVRAEIAGSYVIDGKDVMSVIVPINAGIESIRVVSTKPEESVEGFKLRVESSIKGEAAGETEVLGELGGGKIASYSLELFEGFKPVIKPSIMASPSTVASQATNITITIAKTQTETSGLLKKLLPELLSEVGELELAPPYLIILIVVTAAIVLLSYIAIRSRSRAGR